MYLNPLSLVLISCSRPLGLHCSQACNQLNRFIYFCSSHIFLLSYWLPLARSHANPLLLFLTFCSRHQGRQGNLVFDHPSRWFITYFAHLLYSLCGFYLLSHICVHANPLSHFLTFCSRSLGRQGNPVVDPLIRWFIIISFVHFL